MSFQILVLHSLGRRAGPFCIEQRALEQFLRGARKNGWTFSTVSALVRDDYRKEKVCVITFDDAYESIHASAFPLMLDMGVVGTVFVNTDAVGGRNDWNRRAAQRLFHCNWQQLRQLSEAGWEIGSHTHHHFNLLSLCNDEICDEIETSNQLIEQYTSAKPTSFSYPYGKFDDRAIQVIRSYYEVAVATEHGGDCLIEQRWQLRRRWPELLHPNLRALFFD